MLTDGRTDGRTDARTDGRTDDGRKVITIAHPEQSSGELKINTMLIALFKLHKQRLINEVHNIFYVSLSFFSNEYPQYNYVFMKK